MTTFDEARAALEGLWEEELAELQQRQEEAEEAVESARREVGRLEEAISANEAELRHLRAEFAELPRLLAEADLRGDDQAEGAVRRRYAEIEGAIPVVEERLEDARAELHAVTGGDLEYHLKRLEREHLGALGPARLQSQERRLKEWSALRDLLEDLYPGRPRTAREIERDETRRARQRQAAREQARTQDATISFAEREEYAALRLVAQQARINPSLLEGPSGPGLRKKLEEYGLLEEAGLGDQRDDADSLARHIAALEQSAGLHSPADW